MKFDIEFQNSESRLEITKTDTTITIERDGKKSIFNYKKSSGGYILEIDGKIFHTNLQSLQGEKTVVSVGDKMLKFDWKNPYAFRSGDSQGGDHGIVKAVMPGRVAKILVKLGQVIEINQPLLVLEAMKMENEIKSSKAGQIKTIQIQEGDSVESGATLISIE